MSPLVIGKSRTIEQTKLVVKENKGQLERFHPIETCRGRVIYWGNGFAGLCLGKKVYPYIDLFKWSKDFKRDKTFTPFTFQQAMRYAEGRLFGLNHMEARYWGLTGPDRELFHLKVIEDTL